MDDSLLDVFPDFAISNHVYGCGADVIGAGQGRLGCPIGCTVSDGEHLRSIEFGHVVPLATQDDCGVSRSTHVVPALRNHVMSILGVGAEEQMPPSWQSYAVEFVGALFVIPETPGDIAGVQDIDIVRDRFPGCQLPGDAMDAEGFPVQSDFPVTFTVEGADPEPVGRILVDTSPEAIGYRNTEPGVHAFWIAELPGPSSKAPRANQDWGCAVVASPRHGTVAVHRDRPPDVWAAVVTSGALPFTC